MGKPSAGVGTFFSASEAREERWRELHRAAKALAAGKGQGEAAALLAELAPLEELCGYPGPALMAQVSERLKGGDGAGLQRLTQRISLALLCQQLPRRSRGLEVDDEEGDPHLPKILPPSIGRGQARKPYCEVLIVIAGRALGLGRGARRHPQAAARHRPVRGRAGGGRQLRGRAAGDLRQLQHPGSGDVRRLRLWVADPAADLRELLAAHLPQAAAARDGDLVHAARARSARHPARARRLPLHRPRRRQAGRRRRGGGHPARVLRAGGDARAASRDPRGPCGPLRDALLRQPQEVRAAPDRHLPRPADRTRQVDLQVELDPRHGRVLRREPVPRRVLRHHRRPRQPARADRQHQGGAGQGGARLRRRPCLLRHQRHLDLQQDHPPGGVPAGRHRADRPRLPQVAPLRPGARRRAALLHRRLPAYAVLDVRLARHQADQGRAASSSRPKASSTRCACWC